MATPSCAYPRSTQAGGWSQYETDEHRIACIPGSLRLEHSKYRLQTSNNPWIVKVNTFPHIHHSLSLSLQAAYKPPEAVVVAMSAIFACTCCNLGALN